MASGQFSPIRFRGVFPTTDHRSLTTGFHYHRHFPASQPASYISFMSTGTGTAKYRCAQCEKPEDSCECEKFCCLCQAALDVRICSDGLMYCEPCRKACDYKTSD